jgi:tubulin alpha
VFEPYNACLAIKNQKEKLDMIIALDNEALYDICDRLLPVNVKPTYQTINQLIGRVASGLTTSLRFEGELNVDLGELKTNLIPRPDLNFLLCATTPVTNQDDQDQMRVFDLTFEAFDNFNHTVRCNPSDGKYMASCLMYRGDVMPAQVNKAVQKLQEVREIKFVEWCPTGFKIGINYAPLVHGEDWLFNDTCRSLTSIVNNTEIVQVLDRIANQYFQLFKKHAFVHWFTAAGLDMSEFESATETFQDIHNLYTEIKENDSPNLA